MFELATYRCPDCSTEIRDRLSDGQQFDCLHCRHSFRILLDESSKSVGFIPLSDAVIQEPLHLPRGSIRAMVTLATAGSCWVLMLGGGVVPGYLLSLLLTIIGYYFGFRQKLRNAAGRILDPSARAAEPLHLPGGTIRLFLVLGFAVCGAVVYARGQLTDPAYLEFFVVLTGLVAGYFFARFFAGAVGAGTQNLLNHVKGVLVLAAAVILAALLLSGLHMDRPRLALTLAAAVSFYFGSRS